MRTDHILQTAQDIANHLAEHKRYNRAEQDLKAIRHGRGSLTLQLLDVSEHQLDRAINLAETEAHSRAMMLDELIK